MRSFIAISVLFEMALRIAAVPVRDVSGVSMPEVISVAGKELMLNGIGLVKEMALIKVYVAGLYLEKPTVDARTAITADEAKRIVIVMLRDVTRERFVHAVQTGVMRNSGRAMPLLRGRLDLLEKALPALKKGDVLSFTYLPGVGTEVRGQGREMTIPGKDFADALFSVWLGPKPANGAIKRELLGGSALSADGMTNQTKSLRPAATPPSGVGQALIRPHGNAVAAEPMRTGQFITKELRFSQPVPEMLDLACLFDSWAFAQSGPPRIEATLQLEGPAGTASREKSADRNMLPLRLCTPDSPFRDSGSPAKSIL